LRRATSYKLSSSFEYEVEVEVPLPFRVLRKAVKALVKGTGERSEESDTFAVSLSSKTRPSVFAAF
jgi:hypothetical protein